MGRAGGQWGRGLAVLGAQESRFPCRATPPERGLHRDPPPAAEHHSPDFWRLVYDYGCTSIVMLNQLHQSNSAWVRAPLARLASCLHPGPQSVQGRVAKSGVGAQLCHLPTC